MKIFKNLAVAAALLLTLNAYAADATSTADSTATDGNPAAAPDAASGTAPARGGRGARGARGARGRRGARGGAAAAATTTDTSASGLVGDFVANHLTEVLSPLAGGVTTQTAFQLKNNVAPTIKPNLPDFQKEVLALNNDLSKAATAAPDSMQAVYKQAQQVAKLFAQIGDDYKKQLTNYVDMSKPVAADPNAVDGTPEGGSARGGKANIVIKRQNAGTELTATREQQNAKLSVLEDAWAKSCKDYQQKVTYAVDQLRAADRKAQQAANPLPATTPATASGK